ncbi:MAG TPA: hypothetical protein VL307_08870, partial [Chitinophagaceae bacterium]|nr:hypothetical protein [Chitinophagaceae bacterium]
SSHSFFLTAYVGWNFKLDSTFGLTDYMNIGNSGFLYYLAPSTGLEYQQRYAAKNPAIEGAITRWYFSMDARLRFKNGKGFTRRYLGLTLFELTANYTGRKKIGSNLAIPENYTHLFKTEFSYYPLQTENFSIGLSYNNGEDPISAIELQNFWQLAFKLKLTY